MSRFTIRDLLWLTVVVALGVGWWLHYRSNAMLRDDLRAATQWRERIEEACNREGVFLWDRGRRGVDIINVDFIKEPEKEKQKH